jgi:hypothetical protein
MSPERRYSARRSVDLCVHIRYRGRRLHCAIARNLSVDGMYLDVRSITLPNGTLVELELEIEGKELLVPAIVVHHSGSGVGVMFRSSQPELFESLCRINRTHGPEARSRFAATGQAHPA